MRYLIAFFLPWAAFFSMGMVGRGIICLILQCTVIGWIPATIWAFSTIGNYYADKRTDRVVKAIVNSRSA
ncbi:MAG TPA: YqaE/Pmp3 family membrane protein [Xanthobacteraceae bacterium]|nr:YqaE/Pmp3 family membrane protein [Xanthobacteraceae bacterium]